MAELLNFINNLLWDSLLIYLLLGTGIWFTLRTGFSSRYAISATPSRILKDSGTRGGGIFRRSKPYAPLLPPVSVAAI